LAVKSSAKTVAVEPPTGFDVTCVIGRVSFDQTGEFTPAQAAYLLIAEHDADGHYSFPSQSGGIHHVTVEYEPSAEQRRQEEQYAREAREFS
jgi:hypothetical protein